MKHLLSYHAALQRIVLIGLMMATAIAVSAQERRVTPVRPETNTVRTPDKNLDPKYIEQYLTGDSLKAQAEARKDSLRRVYPRYPRLTDVALGVNFIDPLLMALGQDYASVDVSATLNMWNRLQPVVELGLGWAKSKPDDMNYTYRCKPSPYFKVGANYNFLFKSKPQYQAYAGLRLGFSTFGYEVIDVTHHNSYWQETATFSIDNQRSHALWGELVAGLKVTLFKQVALGWSLRYRGVFNYKKTDNSRPWYIPGYGKRSSSLGFTVTAYYTLPLSRHKWPATD